MRRTAQTPWAPARSWPGLLASSLAAACLIENPLHDPAAGSSDGPGGSSTTGSRASVSSGETPEPASTGSSSGAEPEPDPTTTTSPATSAAAGTSVGPTQPPDVAVCDPGVQECPDGEKCNPFAAKVGGGYDSAGCFPVARLLQPDGDSCDFFDYPRSGHDNCDLGATCLSFEVEGDFGVCHRLCNDDRDALCEAGSQTCVPHVSGVFSYCARACDLLLQDCDGDQGCYLLGNVPACVPPGDSVPPGSECSFVQDCAPGSACISSDFLPDLCTADSCCAEFCMLGDSCPMGLECVDVMLGPPGVGLCVEPI
ncbi:MAG: hypothetical protein AAF721_20990 [Myxococcota bacterium]